MELRLERDEAWSLMAIVASYVIDNSGVSQAGKQKIRRWRSDNAENSPEMESLADGMNQAIGAYFEAKTDRQVRRRGRYVRVSERK
jgi:hypothetical protein